MKVPKTLFRVVILFILTSILAFASLEYGGEQQAGVNAMSTYPAERLNDQALDDELQSDFSASPRYGQAPLTVSFAVHISGDFDVLEWDYGDGTSGGGWNPKHTYTAPGVYNVTLTASNSTNQDTETKEAYICVDTQCAGYDSLSYANHIGGAAYSVAVRDQYAYIGEGHWLSIVDITDPLSPNIVGSTTTLPNTVWEVVVDGDYAYLANGYDGGLRIIDISDPQHPFEVSFYRTGYTVRGVRVVGTMAYIVDSEGLRIIDVSDPTSPVERGAYLTGWKTHKVDVVGTTAYMVDDGNAMRIVDVTDPANPFELSRVTVFDATDIEVVGNWAYIATGALTIYNISNPAQPVFASAVHGGASGMITFNQGKAYITDFNTGLHIYDLSNPYNPSRVGSYRTITRDVAVSGNIAYLSSYGLGLELIDVADVRRPTQLGLLGTPDRARDIEVVDATAFLGAEENLHVIDVSAPENPTAITSLELPAPVDNIVVSDGVGYVSYYSQKNISIIDVSDRNNPVIISGIDTPSNVRDIKVIDHIIYITCQYTGLYVVDVADSLHPVPLGEFELSGEFTAMDVAGDIAYLAKKYSLVTVDVSDPTHLTLITEYELPRKNIQYDVLVSDEIAYLGYIDGVDIIDVFDPFQPEQIATYDNQSPNVRDLAIVDSTLYVASRDEGLRIVNVSDPSQPNEIDYFDKDDQEFYGVEVIDDVAYTAAGVTGLSIIAVDNLKQPSKLSSLPAQRADDVDVADEYAYIVNNVEMHIVDVHNPSQLEAVSQLRLPRGNVAIRVQDGIAYIANGSSGLHLVDVSDPTKPFEISSLEIPKYTYNLDLEGDIAYVAASWDGLSIVDVSDPLHPHEIGRYETNAHVFDVDVSGGIAYLAEISGEDGLRMIDISDPVNPSELGVYPARWGVDDVAVANKTACIGIPYSDFGVIDVTDPAEPTEMRLFELFRGQTRVAIEGDYAYVVVDDDYESNTVRIVDISTPSMPYVSTFLEIPTDVRDIRVKDGLIYVASGSDGLVIFSHDSSQIKYLPLYLAGN